MKINNNILVSFFTSIILLTFSSCGINLTSNNSFGSTEAYLMQAESNDDSENTNSNNDAPSTDADYNSKQAENEIYKVCGDDLRNCLYTKIVRPTGGCGASTSCIPLPDYLLHIYPYDYTRYTFYKHGTQDVLKSITVNKNSKTTSIKNVVAEELKGLDAEQTYDLIIETKTDDGTINIQKIHNLALISPVKQ